jgi:hypothetical protein
MIKLRTVKWAEHKTCIEGKTIAHKTLVRKLKETGHFRSFVLYEKMILKLILT